MNAKLEIAPWVIARPTGAPVESLQDLTDATLDALIADWFLAQGRFARARDAVAAEAATPVSTAAREYATAQKEVTACLARLRVEAASAGERVVQRMAAHATAPSLREYALLSGPNVERALAKLGQARGRQRRRGALLVARIVQRMAAKCESIGRYGPVAWIGLADPTFRSRAARRVQLEHWAVQALAQAFIAEHGPLAVELAPPFRLENGCLLLDDDEVELPPTLMEVLMAVAPGRTLTELDAIASTAGVAPDEARDAIDQLVGAGALRPLPSVPPRASDPLSSLGRWLEQAPTSAAARVLAESIAELQMRVSAVAETAAAERTERVRALDDAFSSLTKQPAYRRHGQLYGARRIFFEECSRELELPDLRLAEYAPAWALLAEIASWQVTRTAELREREWEEACEGSVDLPLQTLLTRIAETTDPSLELRIDAEARQRVAALLGSRPDVSDGSDDINLDERDLDQLRDAFAHGPSRYREARWHTLSLALAQNGLFCVAGMQRGVSTFTIPMFLRHCPDAAAVSRYVVGDGRCTLGHDEASRASIFPPDFDTVDEIELRAMGRDLPVRRTPISAWRVRRGTRGLVATAADREIPLMELLGERMISQRFLPIHFGLLDGERRPRLQFRELVLARRGWLLPSAEIAELRRKHIDLSLALVSVMTWRHQHGLPRRVYVRSSAERSPLWLDLNSPLSALELMRLAKRSKQLFIEEALPDMHQAPLGSSGASHHCEVRLLLRRDAEVD
jgi:hypothetical protein